MSAREVLVWRMAVTPRSVERAGTLGPLHTPQREQGARGLQYRVDKRPAVRRNDVPAN